MDKDICQHYRAGQMGVLTWKRYCFIGLLSIGLISLASCATWHRHGVVFHPPEKIRIAVLPVHNGLKIKKLKNIQSLTAKPDPATEANLIQQQMKGVTDHLTSSLEAELNAGYFFAVVPGKTVEQTLQNLFPGRSSETLTPQELKTLGARLDVPLLLTTRLAGYGKIKKRWMFYLIGSGAIEGTVQGILSTLATDNPWVGAGIAAEELLQETLTWGGGIFLFDKIFTPVILEGKLISAVDGKTIWNETAFVNRNGKGLKQIPKSERKKKEVRLRLTSEKAVAGFTRHLNKQAWRNLEYRPMEPSKKPASGPSWKLRRATVAPTTSSPHR